MGGGECRLEAGLPGFDGVGSAGCGGVSAEEQGPLSLFGTPASLKQPGSPALPILPWPSLALGFPEWWWPVEQGLWQQGLVSEAGSTNILKAQGGERGDREGLILHDTHREPHGTFGRRPTAYTFCPHKGNSSVHPHFLYLVNPRLPLPPLPVIKHPCTWTFCPGCCLGGGVDTHCPPATPPGSRRL